MERAAAGPGQADAGPPLAGAAASTVAASAAGTHTRPCRYSRIVSIARYSNYHYRPTRRQHAKICALIVKAAGDGNRPAAGPAGDPPRPGAAPAAAAEHGARLGRAAAGDAHPHASADPDPAGDPDDLPAALSANVTSTTHAVVEVTCVA